MPCSTWPATAARPAEAAAGPPAKGLLRNAAILETQSPELPAPTEGQTIADDYRSLRFTLHRHPLALLRDKLRRAALKRPRP